MKKTYHSDVRLTDALERKLLQDALEAQQRYWLDHEIKQLFLKVLRIFKTPEDATPAQTAVRTAH
ncbi:hypothetical protein [Castellaniella sp.]|uniref:hypothetical protein n=1 Tax=Castellaniella sp. TaxID=1955812 RepID=UPI00355F1B19